MATSTWNYGYDFRNVSIRRYLNVIKFLIFTFFSIFRISVSGNFIVIHVFTTTKALMTPSNLLIINLAFADFFMLVSAETFVKLKLKNKRTKLRTLIIYFLFHFILIKLINN